MSPQALMVSQS